MKCFGCAFRLKAKVKIERREQPSGADVIDFPNANTLRVCVYTAFVLRCATIVTALSSSPFGPQNSSQHVQEIMTYASRYLDHG